MKTVGIVAEYNPFHNGHAYHIEEAKKITGADCAVVIMSGNFVQRGTPAILDKYTRTKMALLGGADLIIELPTLYATASAELFALGSVLTLEKLHHIDFLCFGSEEGKLEPFLESASFLLEESASFKTNLSLFLKQGDSFPKARAKALNLEQFGSLACQNNNNLDQFLAQPNNILGIEYVKTIKKYHSSISPITIQRKNVHYHDNDLHQFFSSASAIRTAITQNRLEESLSSVPKACHSLLLEQYGKYFPICLDDFSSQLYFLLQRETNSLSSFLDIKEELANRIQKFKNPTFSITEFISVLKNKALTYTAIQRGILHYLLNIKKELLEEVKLDEIIYYARILGMNQKGAAFLKEAKKTSEIPLIQRPAKAYKVLSPLGKQVFDIDLRAYELYQLIQYEKFQMQPQSEYLRGIVRVDSSCEI